MKILSHYDFYFPETEAESPWMYQPGGYHPVHLGDVYSERYRVIHKLGYGSYSTVWLARDLLSTAQTRYVALKFVVAERTGRSNEIKIHQHLRSQPGKHPGSEHVIALLDNFKVQGPNGEHDVLVFQVLGPHLVCTFRKHIFAIHKSIKSLVRQMALGISFLHHCGVVHADLYNANIAFEIPDLDGEPEEDVMNALGAPTCTAVLTRDQMDQTDSLPRYVVAPENLLCRVQKDNLRIKITDLGGAFFSTETPRNLCCPLELQAPEALINGLSKLPRIRYTTKVDVWSLGCLIYELVSLSCIVYGTRGNRETILHDLATLLGPLPQEWRSLLGASPLPNDQDFPLEECIPSHVVIDDPPGFISLLREVLVFEPLQRPEVSKILDHPWLGGPHSPSTPSGPALE